MKTTTVLTVLVFALCLMVCQATISRADDMGTAFTYQGRLIDDSNEANGPYDFQYKLFDDATDGNQIGSDVNKPSVDVIEGYFTVELDFGDVFNGDASWLEIGVRDYDPCDVNMFTTLSPRQEITPSPYALYAKTAGGDGDWMVDGNDMYSIPSGDVGIGTTTPINRLTVQADANNVKVLRLIGPYGEDGYGARLNFGDLEQVYIQENSDDELYIYSERQTAIMGGNVGIGEMSPQAKLHIGGTAGVDGIKFPDGTLQTTAATAGGGDNLGDHTATQNIELDGNWLSGDGENEGVYVDSDGQVGIGTASPDRKLNVFEDIDSRARFVRFDNANVGSNASAQLAITANTSGRGSAEGLYLETGNLGLGGFTNHEVLWSNTANGLWLGTNNASGSLHLFTGDMDTSNERMTITNTGDVGIGTTEPLAKLHLFDSNNPILTIDGYVEGNSHAHPKLYFRGCSLDELDPNRYGIIQADADLRFKLYNGSWKDVVTIKAHGEVGIGTTSPHGALDVNGPICQRGGLLHADYVFEPEYQLETIDEHSEFMWQNKHLSAIPKARIAENGQQLVEVGAHRRGIVEELEKAHIYIEQLHRQNKALEKRVAVLEKMILQQQLIVTKEVRQ